MVATQPLLHLAHLSRKSRRHHDEDGGAEEQDSGPVYHLSKLALKKLMAEAARTALRYRAQPARKAHRGTQEANRRRNDLEKEKEKIQDWQKNNFRVWQFEISSVLGSVLQQKLVCDLFERIFGYDVDEDFTTHTPPTSAEIKAFALQKGPGPDINNLWIDMQGNINL